MKNKILSILVYFLVSLSLHALERADLIEKVIPAVVSISSEQIIKSENNDRTIKIFPRDDFFDDFRRFFDQFDKFFMDDKTPRHAIFLGSGFIVDQGGIIVTNYHVIQNAKEITVTMNDTTDFKAEVLGYDAHADLAVLKINADKPLPYVDFGDSDKVRVGDSVIAVGNPFGLGGSVSAGIISAKFRNANIPGNANVNEFIQTDAAINMGNSGGPLFNLNGQVVGINTAIYSPNAKGNIGIGFAIPSNSAIPVVDVLKRGEELKHGFLGVTIQPLTREMAETLGIKNIKGVIVSDIVKDSPADKAGIKLYDILLEFNGKEVSRTTQLVQMVLMTEPKSKVKIKLLRKGKEINVEAIIKERVDHRDYGNDYKKEDKSNTGYITGFTVSDLSRENITKKGVVVVDVDYNSHAASHVRKGDIIMQVNGADTTSTKDFNKQIDIAIKKNDTSILLLIYRNGHQSLTVVKLRGK
ncbi:protease Do [Wolbachia pipientis]|uniref:Probable periplasmic serine endoprotease DegP-like n=1 Tax=Wolbachia pipientis TaxID=955 RepID=A0A1E7QJ13_WOLPI|nr:Do family serine endopeptidase [Wolbachia pipientis]OEY86367.1 protease Do [Wolbachia pipientis]